MSGTMSAKEWLDKADYEGGIYGGLECGMSAADLAPGVDPEFRAAVSAAERYSDLLDEAVTTLMNFQEEES